jgi:hypothetical protein
LDDLKAFVTKNTAPADQAKFGGEKEKVPEKVEEAAAVSIACFYSTKKKKKNQGQSPFCVCVRNFSILACIIVALASIYQIL